MVVAEARRILESIGTEQKIVSEAEKQYEIKKLLHTIRGNYEESKEKTPVISISKNKKWWYAAALLAALQAQLYISLKRVK